MHDFDLKKARILDRVGIVDVVSQHVALKRRGKRWVGLCPFHSEKTPSFTVNPELGLFKCFGCGKGGDVFSFVQLRENVPFIEAMRMLADRAGVELGPAARSESDGPGRADLARVNAWAMEFFRSNLRDESGGRTAREYLSGREVSGQMIERFSLGLATDGAPSLPEAASRAGVGLSLLIAADLVRRGDNGPVYDTFRNRLIFPIRDATNRVVGFGGRTLVGDRAKYLNTRQTALFDKGRGLYGIELAREAMVKSRRGIVVEGYTDCMAAHQAGFAETVASLGTALTESQVDLVRRYCDEIILLFDSDEAGEAAADRGVRVALPRCVTVRLARIPDGKDPCEFLSRAGASAFSDVLNRACGALEFKWSQTLKRFGTSASPAARRDAMLEFVGVVVEACETGTVDEIQRGLLANQVAHVLQVESREVHRLMARLQKRRTGKASETPAATGDAPDVPARDSEQAAWSTLLEVVLNESGVLVNVESVPDVKRIADERDRRIAAVAFELAEDLGEFRVADVLARCHDPADGQRVAELARRGAARENYERTFHWALEQIRIATGNQEFERNRQRLLATQREEEPVESARDELANIHRHLMGQRHYIPRRLNRRTIAGAHSVSTDETGPVGALEQP